MDLWTYYNERNKDNVIVEYLPGLSSLPGCSSVDASGTAFLKGASIDYQSDSSGVIQYRTRRNPTTGV